MHTRLGWLQCHTAFKWSHAAGVPAWLYCIYSATTYGPPLTKANRSLPLSKADINSVQVSVCVLTSRWQWFIHSSYNQDDCIVRQPISPHHNHAEDPPRRMAFVPGRSIWWMRDAVGREITEGEWCLWSEAWLLHAVSSSANPQVNGLTLKSTPHSISHLQGALRGSENLNGSLWPGLRTVGIGHPTYTESFCLPRRCWMWFLTQQGWRVLQRFKELVSLWLMERHHMCR